VLELIVVAAHRNVLVIKAFAVLVVLLLERLELEVLGPDTVAVVVQRHTATWLSVAGVTAPRSSGVCAAPTTAAAVVCGGGSGVVAAAP